MIIKITPTLVLLSCFICLESSFAFQYITGEDFKNDLHAPIPLERKENVLIMHKERRATSIIYVFREPCEKVNRILVDIVSKGFGGAGYAERSASEFPDLKGRYDRNEMKNEIDQFNTMNINLKKFKEAKISARRYNADNNINQYSELSIRSLNGRDVIRKNCTILLVERTDHWMDRRREFHTGIPLSISKYPVETKLITSTEIGLIEKAVVALGSKTPKYYFPDSARMPLRDIELWKKIINDMDDK